MKYSHDKPKIVLVPYPAQGHVTPMLHLASVLQAHGFQSVMVTPEFIHTKISSQAESIDTGIMFASVPDGLDVNEPRDFFTISYAMENVMPVYLESVLLRLCEEDGGVVCVVADLLASWAIQIAKRCRVQIAGFWPAMDATFYLIKAIPDMIRLGLISEFGTPQHQGTMCFLPGQPMLRAEDLPWLVGNASQRKSRFRFWLQVLSRSSALPWILVNSFQEHKTDSSGSTDSTHPKVFQVAPLTRNPCKNPSFWEEDQTCMKWLDQQKPNSVVYVSFGSWVGPIDQEKIGELAIGLESTRRPFIWVLGPKWRKGLPRGYLERVSRYSKVVSWAPQKEILGHKGVGCYMTHCGWNSTMEAIECGKRMVCYPIAGDQFVNCTYIVKVWEIGVKMDGIGRDDVVKGVKMVMEDGEMEVRVMKLKERVMGREGVMKARNNLANFIDDVKKLRSLIL